MAATLAISAANIPPPSTKAAQPELTAAGQLQQAREALIALQLRLKPEHPDVIRAQRTIRELEEKALILK